MLYILLLKFALSTELSYDYDKLMYLIAEKESRFQCQVVDPYNITYGKYQITPHLIQKMGYSMPLSCAEQDKLMRKVLQHYETLLNIEKYEFKYYKGTLLHRTNLLIAMHFAPFGTIRYLEHGVDFSNGLISVSGLLKRYESTSFYEVQ
ncbi:MAG: hypothetical protein OHK0053_30000 [Microscillaceae bacterium]